MKNTFKALLIVLASLVIAECPAAAATGADIRDPEAVGELSNPNYYDKEVMITPTTRSIQASQFTVVKFTSTETGKSFVWNFNTRSWANFELTAVAPPGVIPEGHKVMAYVWEKQRAVF